MDTKCTDEYVSFELPAVLHERIYLHEDHVATLPDGSKIELPRGTQLTSTTSPPRQ